VSSNSVRAAFAKAVVAELATAIGAIAPGPVASASAAVVPGPGWQVTLKATGARTGTLNLWTDTAGAVVLARLVLGMEADTEPDEAAVADLLRELWTQAASATTLRPEFSGIKVAVDAATPHPLDPADAIGFKVDLEGHGATLVAMCGDFEPERQTAIAVSGAQPGNLDVVLDMELPLIVRFGRTVMSIKALSGLGPGSIVDMNRTPDDLVDIIVSDQVIARGEVVVVSGNYGVRVTELLSRDERVRVLEA